MTYVDEDIATLERNAWQRGDFATADLLAKLIDAQEEQERMDAEHSEDAAQANNRAEESEKRIRELEQQLDRAYDLVEAAARVSNRAEILKALKEAA